MKFILRKFHMDMLTCALQDNKLIYTNINNNYRQIKLLIEYLFKKDASLKVFYNYQQSLHVVFLRVACSKV